MELSKLLRPNRCFARVTVASKTALLQNMAFRIGASLELAAEPIAVALSRREELGSTGLGEGVAIPHARMQDVMEPAGFFCTLNHPISFDAIDGHPVDLAFFLLLPTIFQAEHLNALALIARRFREKCTCKAARKAENEVALCDAFLGGTGVADRLRG